MTENTPSVTPPRPPEDVYKPVFSDRTRTIVYLASLLASIVGLGFMSFGHPEIGGFISTAAAAVAGGFGVAYNPVRLAGK